MIIMTVMIIATYTYDYNNNNNINNREPLGEPAFRRRTGRRQQRELVINPIWTLYRVALFDKGNRLLEINPDLLIIVEGILSAGNLMGALIHPIELSRPEKLVYSGHIYPFSPIISDLDYPLFKSLMHTMQVDIIDTKNCSDRKDTISALSLLMFMVKFVLKSTLDTLPILTGNFK